MGMTVHYPLTGRGLNEGRKTEGRKQREPKKATNRKKVKTMRKNQVTAEQLQELKNILQNRAIINHFEMVRQAVEKVGLQAITVAVTEEEKNVFLRIRAAMYNPDDYGINGKLNEIEKRQKRSIVTNTPMRWGEYNARRQDKDDMVVIVNGKRYAIEQKSSRGDWARVQADNIEDALEEYANFSGWICWDTEDFTIFMPIRELMEKLDGYRLGRNTFFEKKLSYLVTTGNYCLKMQAYHTSPKKVAFLQAVGATGYNYDRFILENVLERL